MNSDSTTLAPEPDVKTSASSAKNAGPAQRNSAVKTGQPFSTRNIIFAFVGLIALVWLGKFILHAYRFEDTDDAYIAGHLHQISAQVNAPVKEVRVLDNQNVNAGDVLVVLDPAEFQIAVDHARGVLDHASAEAAQSAAAMEQAEAQIAQAEAHTAQAEAQLTQLKAQAQLTHLNLTRNEQLYGENVGAVTQVDLDTARGGAESADAAVRAAEANVVAAKAGVTAANSARDAARAEANSAQANIASAEAGLRAAELQLSYTKIVAPVSGRVGNKAVEVGNRVQAAQVLLDLAAPEIWVIANFKETQLAHMQVGQPVEISVDAVPGKIVHGHIDSFSPASGAQFALLPPDNATGNFNKVVQRVPVKIVIDSDDVQKIGDRLRLGLSVVVDVRVRD